MELTLTNIQNALKGNQFWMNPNSEEAKIINEATKEGFVNINSHTQAEWNSNGYGRLVARESEKLERQIQKHDFVMLTDTSINHKKDTLVVWVYLSDDIEHIVPDGFFRTKEYKFEHEHRAWKEALEKVSEISKNI